MAAEIREFPGRQPPSGGGDGSGPSDLETRVVSMERAIQDTKMLIGHIESKLERHDDALRRIEDALRSLAEDNKTFAKSVADLREKVAHIDGRLANIPTFWQTFSLMAMLLIGIAGLIFTASRFLHP